MSTHRRFWFVWGWPIALGLISIFGLLAALLGTGLWHWASWLSFTALLALIVRYWWFPTADRSHTRIRARV
ncbi:hypothetical protein [Bordetella sp. 15P40C-2]|uniref:hypothetical protein n=1 Tax=Bordetella sp. 15P40C-2 TaxID=2572246 RepID=UPI001F34B15F|nr:hypothetical protein [Bordetella sp. 15P40C-2]